jgi:hypothetical protein
MVRRVPSDKDAHRLARNQNNSGTSLEREHVKTGIIAATMLLGAAAAHAGVVANARITRIEAQASGRFFLYLSAPISGSPSCASQPADVFVVDGKKDGGHVVIALVSMAYSLQKSVHVQGAGTCAAGTSIEALFDIYTLDDVSYSVSPGLRP